MTKTLLLLVVIVWISGCASRPKPFVVPQGALTSEEIYEQTTAQGQQQVYRLSPPPVVAPSVATRPAAVADPLYRVQQVVARAVAPAQSDQTREPVIESWRPGHYATDAYIWVDGYQTHYPLFERYIEPKY